MTYFGNVLKDFGKKVVEEVIFPDAAMEKNNDVNVKEDMDTKPDFVKKNRVFYKQQYRKVWEQLPEFSGWLEPDPKNKARAFCNVCEKFLHAHRLSLFKHTTSIKHMRKAQQQYEQKQQLLATKKVENLSFKRNSSVTLDVPDELEVDCSTGSSSSSSNEKQDSCVKDNPKDRNYLETQTVLPRDVTEFVQLEVNEKIVNSNNLIQIDPALVSPVVSKPPISTHVLDTSKGLPVAGLPVSLYKLVNGRWTFLCEKFTNPDGRCSDLISRDEVEPGRFKLHFNTDKYYEGRKSDHLYPFIEIVFDLHSPTEHIHIPLLMAPYGYTTYKGS